ncbi:MAG TPA: hypothetical protein VKF41_03985 [Bryobacteraceae bacterium]|nr:hypothetical protein [Bryobacteraceae bacterium]
MSLWFRPRIRHPLYPGLASTAAAGATGHCPALYGSFEDLVGAAAAGAQPRRAVFVERRQTNPFLSVRERDELWNRFGVPVLAVLVDDHGTLLGYECEAQQGVHLSERMQPGPRHRLEQGPCDCGRPGCRLVAKPAPRRRCR